jgi:uncharacterized membrane protein
MYDPVCFHCLPVGAWIAFGKSEERLQREHKTKRSKAMDRMLVVVFDSEPQAYEGTKALHQLEDEGSIAIYAYAVIGKNADGTIVVRQQDDPGPLGTVLGTSLGSLIGLLGGPVGFVAGAAAGLVAGGTVDLDNARVGGDFVDDVRQQLQPNKFALVAEIQEDWTTPVDSRMEAIGGTVYRRARSEVKNMVDDENVAAMKADLAQMKAEHANTNAERKAKLQEKINQLDSKIQAQLEKSKQRIRAAEAEAKAKVQILKSKAAALKARAADRGTGS